MSDTSRISHGLGLQPTEPDWPPLTELEVEQLLAGFPQLGRLLAIVWHSPRPFSAAALVQSAGRRVVVKRHHQRVRTPAWLTEEHDFIRYLFQQGLPVAPPLPDQAGHSAVRLGDWVYEVLPLAPGQDLYRDARSWTPFLKAAHAEAAGAALAALHLASAGYRKPPRKAETLLANMRLFGRSDPLAAISEAARQRPELAQALAGRDWQREIGETLLPFHPELWPRLAAEKPLWTHNDWHASNLLWQDDQVAGILDFGLADRTFALFDLATAIERNCVSWLEEVIDADLDSLDALLTGYRRRIPLPGTALQTLAALLPVVHGDFALSELVYFHSLTGSPENADLAYAYLIEHARWFHQPEGQRLLTHLAAK